MNSTLLNEFLTHINEKMLLKPTDKILLAVSGGKDSVCLFDLFLKSKICVFGLAHCNFQLRGNDSNGDEDFVLQLANNQAVRVHNVRFDTKQFAKENQLSTQLAARQLRYEWFEEIRAEFGYDYIATAHHFNDVIETVLLNITKGTGLAGLHGIPAQNGNIIRPMLFATREKIDEYMKENKLEWREDSSNATNDYQRNLLRHEVIPLLKQINPNLEDTFRRNIRRWTSAENALKKDNFLEVSEENDSTKISIDSIQNFYILEEYLKKFGFNFSQVSDIFKGLHSQAGKVFYSENYMLLKDRKDLIISKKSEKKDKEYLIENNTQFVDYQDFIIKFKVLDKVKEFNPKVQIFDYQKLQFPLRLRHWKQGDWFVPLGMKGKKKISDFLIDKKVPQTEKNKILLLLSGDDVVGIIGHRIDERFKVNDTTKTILEVSIEN